MTVVHERATVVGAGLNGPSALSAIVSQRSSDSIGLGFDDAEENTRWTFRVARALFPFPKGRERNTETLGEDRLRHSET